jgi:hypothetical protein
VAAGVMTRSEVQLMNETLFENLMNPGMIKTAIDAVNDFTRIKMREDGFARKLMPPLKIANDELDRQVNTDKPAKVVDKEPDSPAAISIPFATLPTNVYIRGPRYLVAFDRIATPRFTKDVDELRTYVMDIRQVLSDNAIKDMLAEEDSKLIGATNLALIGPDTPVPWSGIPQWETIHGGITRDSVMDALKIMPRTDAHLSAATVLINNVSIMEVMKWGRDEMGGDFSQDVVRNGWSETDFLDKRWVISIKRDLIPDETIFMFADPKFIGKMYILEDTTMYIKRDAYLLEFFAYETLGGTIAHSGGLARADFA